jgi:ubiquinone/menaquinone biosynthesis C-methylase UbiE
MGGEGEWEPDADNWVRWARTPGHDAYWYYRDSFFDGVIAPAGRRTLEIGCGEGRVARDLAARGHRVIGVDTAHTLLRHAQGVDITGAYALANSAALPFPDRSFDVVVAYNSLQVVDDMAGTVGEAGRVLERDGHLCVCVAHPVTDLGRFVGDEAGAPFAMRQPYFETRRVDDTVHSGGLTMTFRGWTYSLEQYSVALEEAGFRIEAIREPRPTREALAYERWQDVPLFLLLRAVKS